MILVIENSYYGGTFHAAVPVSKAVPGTASSSGHHRSDLRHCLPLVFPLSDSSGGHGNCRRHLCQEVENGLLHQPWHRPQRRHYRHGGHLPRQHQHHLLGILSGFPFDSAVSPHRDGSPRAGIPRLPRIQRTAGLPALLATANLLKAYADADAHRFLEPVFTSVYKYLFGKFCCILRKKYLPGDSPPAYFCLVCNKIMLENPHIFLVKTGS